MALLGIPDLSQTAASNTDFAGTSILGTGLVSTADDSFRNLASFIARWRDDLGGASTTAGTNTITVTSNEAFTAYAAGQRFMFKLGGTNTGAATLNITPSGGVALGAKNIKIVSSGSAVDPIAGQLTAGNYAEFQYDGTNMNLLSSAAGTTFATNTQAATATSTTVALTPANLAQERGFSNDPFINLSLSASVGASALTVAIKGADGNDPSAANPVYINFRSATATSGLTAQLTLTAATSLVVSSGSTLGSTSAVATIYALAVFNDAGTARLAIINPLTLPLTDGIASATSEGGAGAADSAGVWYSNAAITSKAYTIIGYITATEATAGTWATAPSTVQVGPVYAANNALPIITPWVTYTPTFTGFGTPTGVFFESRRVGDTLEVRGKFTSGTSTATEARLSMGYNGTDSNVTSSATKVPSIQLTGDATLSNSASGSYCMLAEQSVQYMTFGLQNASSGGLTKQLGNALVSSGTAVGLRATVPIQGW